MKRVEKLESRMSEFLDMPVWLVKKLGYYHVFSIAHNMVLRQREHLVFKTLKEVDEFLNEQEILTKEREEYLEKAFQEQTKKGWA